MFTTNGILEYAENKKDFILNKVSPIDIFHYYIGRFKDVNRLFSSELRDDSNPSCMIYYDTKDNLRYADYGSGENYDCFAYVGAKYGMSFTAVLSIIIDDFHLKTNNLLLTIRKPSISEINWIKESFKKKELSVEIRPWEDYDIAYWGRYKLTPSLLVEYDIFPVKYLFMDGEVVCGSTSSNPCYVYKIGKFIKVYRPNNTDGKWYSNIPANHMFGYKQKNTTGELLIITKSLKDVVVYKMFGYDAVAPQAESILPPISAMNEYLFMYDNVLINYDKDETGIKFSKILCDKYNIKSFTTPYKDISDTILASTKDITQTWLNKKINEIIRVKSEHT